MALTDGIQSPCIHLSIKNEVELDDPLKAQTIVRCTQEFITNAMKHAHAKNLWITVESHAEGLMLRAEDDGVGARQIREGNGLKGMRERLTSVGGYLELAKSVNGFRASVWIPQAL
jgi:signal transduction histidine kinase